MKNDDSRSYKLRFPVAMGSMSLLSKDSSSAVASAPETEAFQMDETLEEATLTLEGQGILIYHRSTGEPSHVSAVQRKMQHHGPVLTIDPGRPCGLCALSWSLRKLQ
jgi:hypothetical protein